MIALLLSFGAAMMSPPLFWPLPQKHTLGETTGTIAATTFQFNCDQPAMPILTRAFARYTQLCVRGRPHSNILAGNNTVLEALDVRVLSSDEYLGLETVWNLFVLKKTYFQDRSFYKMPMPIHALLRRKITR